MTTTIHGLTRDTVEVVLRPEANRELCELLATVSADQLTYGELLGVIALLRAARARLEAELRPARPAKLAVINGGDRRTRARLSDSATLRTAMSDKAADS
jgi:hypothetical protein